MPLELTELDLDRVEGVDAAIVAYPHGAAAPTVAALRGRGVLVVDLSADFRLRDMPTYERWYGEHGAPELFGDARLRADRDVPRASCARPKLVATPGCYPTASVLGAGAAGRRRACSPRSSSTAMQGVSGAGRGGGDSSTSRDDENAFPYKTEGHRHRPEIEQELAALGSPAPVTFVPHLLPLDQGELASCFASRPSRPPRRRSQALYRERYADEPFVHVVDGPPDLRDAARHERVPRLRHGRGARPRDGLLGDRQHLEGRLRPGRSRTST